MMSDKIFNPIRDAVDEGTEIRKAESQAGKTIPSGSGRTETKTYQFEFFGDEKIHSTSFEGMLAHEDVYRMLETLHSQLYENCGRIIHAYLEQHSLDYSGFKTGVIPLKHKEAMNRAECLLKSRSHETIDSHTGDADNYYAVMDHQKWLHEGCCEGCYYAVSRTLYSKSRHYHIVGQTFSCGKCGDNLNGYFAVRTGRSSQQICNSDEKNGEPVLPAFGCIDMMSVLLNIDSIYTAEQVERTAVK